MFSITGATVVILIVVIIMVILRRIEAWRANKIREGHFRRNRGLLLQQLVDRDISERMIFSPDEIKKGDK